MSDKTSERFLAQYNEQVFDNAQKLRDVIFENLPGIIEQTDIAAKMIAYSFGQKYSDMICTIMPSKKGLKLGFYKATDLPDPYSLLEGSGKISRYVKIKSEDQIKSPGLKKLIKSALKAYEERTKREW